MQQARHCCYLQIDHRAAAEGILLCRQASWVRALKETLSKQEALLANNTLALPDGGARVKAKVRELSAQLSAAAAGAPPLALPTCTTWHVVFHAGVCKPAQYRKSKAYR